MSHFDFICLVKRYLATLFNSNHSYNNFRLKMNNFFKLSTASSKIGLRTFSNSSTLKAQLNDVFIVSSVRSPIGSMKGSLSSLSAPQIGAQVIRACLDKVNFPDNEVNEVYMGNVLGAGQGQAPATQALIFAGLPNTTPATTINKVSPSYSKTTYS